MRARNDGERLRSARRDGDKRRRLGAEHEPGTRKTLDINGVEFAFRFCPGDSVAVGAKEEKKVVDVDDYWTLETEVACAMWKAIVGRDQSQWGRESDTPGQPSPWTVEIPEKYANEPAVRRCAERGKKVDTDKFPADCVALWTLEGFLEKLNATGAAPEGFEFRLPTEAEWERACRAGTTTRYYWGDEWDVDKARCRESAVTKTPRRFELPRPVEGGLFEPNPWGLRDMFGNVAEWTSDEFVDDGGRRCWIIRGGSWATRSDDYREDFRDSSWCSGQTFYGLRVVGGRKAPKQRLKAAARRKKKKEKTPPFGRKFANGGGEKEKNDGSTVTRRAA